MCGRYSTPPERYLEELFQAELYAEYHAVFNAAPTQLLPVILNTDRSQIVPAMWGFIPFYKKEPKRADGIINARAESLLEGKPAFKRAFEERRCLVIGDGFYEWQKQTTGPKQPYRIARRDGRPFAFAGIWRYCKELNSSTYAIVTTAPNITLSPIHNRMPVILSPEGQECWLQGEGLEGLMKPYPDEETTAFRVSPLVNSPRNNVPEVMQPLD